MSLATTVPVVGTIYSYNSPFNPFVQWIFHQLNGESIFERQKYLEEITLINLDGYQVVQLTSCMQYDGVNCDVICLTVYTQIMHTCQRT